VTKKIVTSLLDNASGSKSLSSPLRLAMGPKVRKPRMIRNHRPFLVDTLIMQLKRGKCDTGLDTKKKRKSGLAKRKDYRNDYSKKENLTRVPTGCFANSSIFKLTSSEVTCESTRIN
jgi:hypothetical protein